jgi:hypothetical protein
VLCDNALLIAFGREERIVSSAVVEQAARDVGLTAPPAARDARAGPGWLWRMWQRQRRELQL